jgi:hypothetical protein
LPVEVEKLPMNAEPLTNGLPKKPGSPDVAVAKPVQRRARTRIKNRPAMVCFLALIFSAIQITVTALLSD